MSFDWLNQEPFVTLFSVLPDPSCMRVVGGAVRNTLLNLPLSDVDLATQYSPQEIMAFYRNKGFDVIPTGLAHGTVTVRVMGQSFEITTLRRDVQTDGRHAIVSFTDSWSCDAQRRDFTINALYVDHQGRLYDDVGGWQDLQQGLLRFIGCPSQRIQEDYLRILRFFRFWATYGRTADEKSLLACCQWKDQLLALSKERITVEILKILTLPNPWPVWRVMAQEGIVALVWGGDPANPSSDVARAMIMAQLEEQWGSAPWGWPCALIRLASLTTQWPAAMILSNKQQQMLRRLWSVSGDGIDVWATFYDADLPTLQSCLWMDAFQAMWRAYSTHGTVSGAQHHVDHVHAQLLAAPSETFPPFPLSGQDIMNLGYQGAAIGQLLAKTKALWIQQRGRIPAMDCLHQLLAVQSRQIP